MPRRYLLLTLICAHAAFGQVSESLLKGMQYRLVGPFRGGRVLAVTGIPGDPQTYYFGAAAGGVWKSIDGGAHWTPQFDKQDIASIGSIAVAPSDPNVLYVGSGEGCLRGDISYGDGVYRSNDCLLYTSGQWIRSIIPAEWPITDRRWESTPRANGPARGLRGRGRE